MRIHFVVASACALSFAQSASCGPLSDDAALCFTGIADYYGDEFHGRKTASGQIHDREKLTAAHRTLPFGTKVKVVNPRNGKSCVVVINDRGPFTPKRIIDLSVKAADEIGIIKGKRHVECYVLKPQQEIASR